MNFLEGFIRAAQQKLKEADAKVGGWLPGGGIPSPATRYIQQASQIIRNPEKQLRNPEAYRVWQSTQKEPRVVEPGGKFKMPLYSIEPDTRTKFYADTLTNTLVEIPEITQGKIFGTGLSTSANPAYEVHFAGPEGTMSKGEFRKYWQREYGPNDRPSDIFSPEDPRVARLRGLALRNQLGRALSEIPNDSWIQTGSAESPYNSRAKLYGRLSQGAFATDPQTNKVTVYKAGPDTWYNLTNPEKAIRWNPSDLMKPLQQEATERINIGGLRETPTGSITEALGRRLGGPQVQAVMLLDDVIKGITGVSPTEKILDATKNQLERSMQEQYRQGIARPLVWQNPPF